MIEPTFTTSDDHRRLETRVDFNADAPLTLSASNASGIVRIDRDPTLPAGTIAVEATRTDGGEFSDDDHHLQVKVDGNSVSIHPDWQFASGVSGLARRIRDQLQHGFRPEDWNLSRLKLSPELNFDIFVRLPASLADNSQIKARTASGEVEIHDLRASASIVTASGDVDASRLTGTIAIHTASGDVEVVDVNESLEVNTASGDVSINGGDAWLAARSASGDVSINGMRMRNSRITTVSGDIEINATFDNATTYGMETVSGDVSLSTILPGTGTSATLGFGTLSGSSSVAGGWEKGKRREWHAGDGEHAVTINVKTVSGDLDARATLNPDVQGRALAVPTRAEPQDTDELSDFKSEMKAFGEEMKQFGRELSRSGHPAPPPVPPPPPGPPHGHGHDLDHGPSPGHEPPPHPQSRDARRQEREERREERRRDREERRHDRQRERDERRGTTPDSSLYTAGPSGVDYRRDTTPVPTPQPAQPTEPVEPPAQFNEEQAVTTTPEPDIAQTAETPRDIPADNVQDDPRLRVLEALEKGEIDIEDALAQLESDRSGTSTDR